VQGRGGKDNQNKPVCQYLGKSDNVKTMPSTDVGKIYGVGEKRTSAGIVLLLGCATLREAITRSGV